MTTADDLFESISKADIPYCIELSLIDTQEDFVRLQQDQLSRGQRSDGQPIFNVKTGSDQYSPSYAKKKGTSSPIDLHDTGAFYGGIFLHVDGIDTVTIDSFDLKSGMLQENYGEEIFDLDDDGMEIYIPLANEALIKEVENRVNTL